MRKLLLTTGGVAAAALALSGGASGSENIIYSYDSEGRLILVQRLGSVNNSVTTNYTLDNADNRETVKTTGAP